MRLLEDLLSPGDEGWTSITGWSASSSRTSVLLPVAAEGRESVLVALQVTTRSVLGAMAWHTSGALLDHGWLRLLGGDGSDLPSLLVANEARLKRPEPPPYLVIAHDVLGGRFAVNGGALPADPGEVAYYAPDTLDWLPTGLTNSAFLEWAFTGDTEAFYADLRWEGWPGEVEAVPPDALLSAYPPLFTEQGRDISTSSRQSVPWLELITWLDDASDQLNGV